MTPSEANTRAGAAFGNLLAIYDGVAATGGAGQMLDVADAMSATVELLAEARGAGRRVFFVGNGASQAIASHMSADFVKNGRMKAMAFTDPSLLTCMGNDLGYAEVFAEPLSRFAEPGDLLVAISSSGCSANILRAVEVADEAGCHIVTLSGFAEENPLRAAGELNFYAPSSQYGEVEVVHHGICHRILDLLIERR